jgi:hypothetical protein
MPTVPLPDEPRLEQLRKQAKDLRASVLAGDPGALAEVAEHYSLPLEPSAPSRSGWLRRSSSWLADMDSVTGQRCAATLTRWSATAASRPGWRMPG